MNLHLNVFFVVALIYILHLANGKYLLVEVVEAEETNVPDIKPDVLLVPGVYC